MINTLILKLSPLLNTLYVLVKTVTETSFYQDGLNRGLD